MAGDNLPPQQADKLTSQCPPVSLDKSATTKEAAERADDLQRRSDALDSFNRARELKMADETADMASSKSYFDMADARFMEVVNKPTDSQQYALAMGILDLSKAQRLALGAIFSRIQRLHQKIDRVERKIGSV
jgi:hypothetical protein